MLLLKIVTLVLLLLIFVQDIQSRSVYWVLFPVLILLFLGLRIGQHQLYKEDWQAVLMNALFLGVQLLILSVYFSIRNKRLVNITSSLLGWGDVQLLFSIAFYLSVFNFLFFYIASLIAVLCVWLIWVLLSKKEKKHIPLAGLQALFLGIYLVIDWWYIPLNLTSDDWIVRLIYK